MRFTRFFFAALAAVALLGYTSVANAAPYTTTGAPPSSLTLQIWLGPPGGEESILASLIGPLAINGTANINLTLDGFGDGSMELLSSNLILDDAVGQLIDIPDLGSILANFVGVALGLNSSAIPVVGNVWDIDGIGAPTTLEIALDQGTLDLYDGTGLLAGISESIDLSVDPVGVGIDDLLGFGIGGTADPSAISIIIPAIDIDLGATLLDTPDFLFVRLLGEIHLVPEPGSIAMLGVGMIGLVAVGRRRFRRA